MRQSWVNREPEQARWPYMLPSFASVDGARGKPSRGGVREPADAAAFSTHPRWSKLSKWRSRGQFLSVRSSMPQAAASVLHVFNSGVIELLGTRG